MNCLKKNNKIHDEIHDEIIEKKIEKKVIEELPKSKSIEQSMEILHKIMKEGCTEFELKNSRPMTYAELRSMYG